MIRIKVVILIKTYQSWINWKECLILRKRRITFLGQGIPNSKQLSRIEELVINVITVNFGKRIGKS